MARTILNEPSRTLMEYRLLPALTTENSHIDKISLVTPIASLKSGKTIEINIPLMAAAMQSVSGTEMAISLSRAGGLAFVYSSQSITEQGAMIRQIKNYKAGFVKPRSVKLNTPIRELGELVRDCGFRTFPVLDDQERFAGLITKNDYDLSLHASLTAAERMISREKLVVGVNVRELKEANQILMESHQGVLPIVDERGALLYLVFRKDIHNHLSHPHEIVDDHKRLFAAAAISTHDVQERLAHLVECGVDLICVDSSDGHSVYQKRAIEHAKSRYPDLPVIGGNIITEEGFRYLVEAGADAIKVGMGGGSICITQEQKGTGRGLATSIMKVTEERNRYFKKTGRYIPVIADGGITTDKDIAIALALGAECVMLGRYFARLEESPTPKVSIGNRMMKPYWGEGSSRARKWKHARYNQTQFEEGVEGFVEYAGRLQDVLGETLAKISAAMSSCGAATIREFQQTAELEVMSPLSIREGQPHDIYLPPVDGSYRAREWGER